MIKKSAPYKQLLPYGKVLLGCVIFAVGFNLFLLPNKLTVGGLSGLSMVLVHALGAGSIGLFTIFLNIPLFIVGFRTHGRRFFLLSLVGMAASSVFIDLLNVLPAPRTDTLLGALAGGICAGAGLGFVFGAGASTGGVDMIARMLKGRFPHISVGRLMFLVDMAVAALTGLAFQDLNKTLYSLVSLYASSLVVDALIYGPDHSTVALVISQKHARIADVIGTELDRGVTVLSARGHYTGQERPVLLCAVGRSQAACLKAKVYEIDPEAFVIFQDAHQVLGQGFRRYSAEDL